MTASAEPDAAYVAHTAQQRVPDFFIVGHPKCGTTALYETLKRHPQIYMPELKETRFFARELHPRMEESKIHPATLEEYLALFAPAGAEQRAGEASPSYLRSQTAAGRIAELQPNARIIALLREPTSFLRSLHLELMQDHVEHEKDLGKAIALERVRRQADHIRHSPGLVYSDYVQYLEQLHRYYAVFPSEQILVLIYEEYRDDNQSAIRQVLRFLDVDDAPPAEVIRANPTVRVRSPRMYEMVRSLYLGQGRVAGLLKAAIKAVTPRRLRRDALGTVRERMLYGQPRPPDEKLMLELRHRFKDEVVALSKYLDRDLVTLWGYDHIT